METSSSTTFSPSSTTSPSPPFSSRNRGYDSNESRRSPRDRSPAPARYDSRDLAQPRSTSYRASDGPSRSSVDSRINSATFPSDRDNFRDSTPRQPSRDFTSLVGPPPRGPKGFQEPPTGPRASSFATDVRGRGAPGRGRGWHESGRDRGRDAEFDYRDRREDRGVSSFRGDRGRDRDWADRERRERESIAYRAPRPSSPGAGYSSRGRPRGRGDWDGRGHGRGFDDRDRYRGRSRTPPSRRASVASPPPQAPVVPAFGTVPSSQTASAPGNAPARISPTPPVNIPTGPRHSLPKPKTLPIQPGRFPRGDNAQWPRTKSVTPAPDPPSAPKAAPPSRLVAIATMVEQKTPDSPQVPTLNRDKVPTPGMLRRPLPVEPDLDEEDSDSESGEDMDHYFEDETKKVQEQLALTSLGEIEWNLTYASQDAVALHPVLETPQVLGFDGDEVDELDESNDITMADVVKSEMLLQMDYEMGEETENEEEEQLAAIRPCIPTPPVSSLPFGPITPWWEDSDLLQDMEDATQHQSFLEQEMIERIDQKEEKNRELGREYAEHYEEYLRFCDSDDPAAMKYRAKVAAAQRAASRAPSVTPQAEGRTEGRRGRFATEHDMARVLQESKKEAQERQERSERVAKAKAASEKEANTPEMIPRDEQVLYRFPDRSRLVPFERAAALLGILPPVDNFTEDECEIFEKTYLDFPKQWSKIAESLPGRNYKNCIQHYYIVKHRDDLKAKLKKKEKGKKKGKAGGAGGKPKSNALMANLGSRDGEDDATDAANGDGERRRPRRAAAPIWPIEAPSESETTTPAPTPGRRTAAVPKGDVSTEPGATKRKGKGNAMREKGVKQAKNGQLLAAAPSVPPKSREDEKVSPAMLLAENALSQGPPEPNRFINQWDGPAPSPKSYAPARVTQDLHANIVGGVVDNSLTHGYEQEFVESAPIASNFEVQHQDRRNVTQQTSSYWSVPEVNEFPGLLKHFGTDWQALAKWMGTKTHIMVKNYYQRQLDSGKSEWEKMAQSADAQRAKGESTGSLPTTLITIKKRLDGTAVSQLRHTGPVVEASDDKLATNQTLLAQHAASPPLSTISRFQALAQASPVPQTRQPPQPTSISSKPPQNQPQQWNQQTIQNRQPRLGFFNPDRERPILQAATTTQPSAPLSDPQRARRSVEVAQEAKLEKEQALRIQEQAQLQAQQRQQQNRRMKEEVIEERPLSNIELYSAPAQQHSIMAPSRSNEPAIYSESRHAPSLQQYPHRNVHGPRDVPIERAVTGSVITMSNLPTQAVRNTASAPPIHHEPPPALRPPPPAVAAVRQPEPVVRKTSSIMSLLNDEPSDPRPQPKPNSDVPLASVRPAASPAPQQLLYQPGRSLSGSQPAPLDRKTSLEEMQNTSQGFSRSTAPPPAPIRVVESTWSAVAQSQPRPQIKSPIAPYHYLVQREQERREGERREQERREQERREQERRQQERREQERLEQERRQQQERVQKVPVTSSQPLPPYYVQQQLNHRQVAFNSNLKVPASPPNQYGPSILSRHGSFDERHGQRRNAPPIQPPIQPQEMHYGTLSGGPPSTMPYQPSHQSHQSHPSLTSTRYSHTESPNTTQAPSQISQQYTSQHQQPPQSSYTPLSGAPLHQHTQSSGSAQPYSPLAYDGREPFRHPPQQPPPVLDRPKLEQTPSMRQQLMMQQQQQQQQQHQHQHQHQHQTQHQPQHQPQPQHQHQQRQHLHLHQPLHQPHPQHQPHQQQQQQQHQQQQQRQQQIRDEYAIEEAYQRRIDEDRRYQESRRG